jgi:ketosteroid isomerase-like protein
MTDSDASWVRRYYAAWDSGDADAITAWFDDDVVLEDVPSAHTARGRSDARRFVEHALKLAPGARYEVITAFDNGDNYAVEWVMHPASVQEPRSVPSATAR